MDADLVLEGGGVKGIALVGALAVFEERGYRFHRVAGTSAGAIVGALVAAGVPASRLHEIVRDIDYRAFRDARGVARFGPIGKGLSLLVHRGIYAGDHLVDWLGQILAEYGVTTFADLHLDDAGGSRPDGEDHRLVVMTSDVSAGSLRRLPWDYPRYGLVADEVEVAAAVRTSMSIPYFYRPIRLHDEEADADRWFVDGGMLSNFPVGVFDRQDGQAPRWPTFGIKLSGRPDAAIGIRNDVRGIFTLSTALIRTMIGFYDRIHLDDPAVVARTVFVDTMQVRTTDFDLDRRTADRLYDNGRRAAERFLDGDDDRPAWDFDAYVDRFRRHADTGS